MSLTNKVLYDIDQSISEDNKARARKNIGAYEDKTTLAGGTGIPKEDLADDVKASLVKADSSVQGVKINGTEILKDSDNKVDVPVPTPSSATPTMDGTASAGVDTQCARGDHRHPTDTTREAVSNKVQTIDPTSTTEYGSSKAVADFVNSSVATNTANFLGSFSLTDLGLSYPATDVQIASALNSHTWNSGVSPTNNDYTYIEIQNPETTGVDDKVERFKFSDTLKSWVYEYTLNNSSFTAAELATIKSGVTTQDVTNLREDHTTLGTHVSDTSNPHRVTKTQVGLGNVVNTGDSATPTQNGTTKFTTGGAYTELNKKVSKISGGNGNLAVITSDGSYASSGITAYNQSAINGQVGNLTSYAERGQYVHTRSVAIETTSSVSGQLFSFTNLRDGSKVLDIGINLGGDDFNFLQFYLPIKSSEANTWIWAKQEQGGTPVALAEVWALRGMVNGDGSSPNSLSVHSVTDIDAYNGTSVISMRQLGGINIGMVDSVVDEFSKVNATIIIRNVITGSIAFVDLSVGVSHYANNNPHPKIWGIATCISDGILQNPLEVS